MSANTTDQVVTTQAGVDRVAVDVLDCGGIAFANDWVEKLAADFRRSAGSARSRMSPPAATDIARALALDDAADALLSRSSEARAAVADLAEKSAAVLCRVDLINPPDGPYWSGAKDQEALRAALARVGGAK